MAQKLPIVLMILVFLLLILDGSLVFYACLIWPKKKVHEPLFIVGVITFMTCFTLPFFIIVCFMMCMANKCQCLGCVEDFLARMCIIGWKRHRGGGGGGGHGGGGRHAADQENQIDHLDLLPDNFVHSNFGSLLFSDRKRPAAVSECSMEQQQQQHVAGHPEDDPDPLQEDRRESIDSSIVPLPRVKFVRFGDMEAPMLLHPEGRPPASSSSSSLATCSLITTQV